MVTSVGNPLSDSPRTNVNPVLLIHDVADRALGDAVLSCHLSVCQQSSRVTRENVADLCLCQLRHSVLRPANQSAWIQVVVMPIAARLPALRDLVAHIVLVCPKEQMIGPDAIPNITTVQDQQPVRNRAEVQFPRDAMGIRRISFDAQHPVPVGIDRPAPQPAGIGLFDSTPEPIFERSEVTEMRAVRPLLHLRWRKAEREIATGTGLGHARMARATLKRHWAVLSLGAMPLGGRTPQGRFAAFDFIRSEAA